MNLEKIFTIVVALILYFLFSVFFKKDEDSEIIEDDKPIKKTDKSLTNLNTDIIEALLYINKHYGLSIAQNVERIFRFETANFTSGQFLSTYSAGMMAFRDYYPYGWITMNREFWYDNPQFMPYGYKEFKENVGLDLSGGGVKKFIAFKDVLSSFVTVAAFLNYSDNNPAAWYSNDPIKQIAYNKALSNINTTLV